MPRTQDEIVARYKAGAGHLFDFAGDVLMDFLDYEHGAALFKTPPSREEYEADIGNFDGFGPPTGRTRPIPASDRDHILLAMRHYAAFGWTKIADHRGISASRTVQKFDAWLWLLGDDEACAWCNDDALYAPYGAPILKRICEKYGFDVPSDQLGHASGVACSKCA